MDAELPAMEVDENLINSFTEITSSSTAVARFFLETHRCDLNAAVSTFKRNKVVVAAEPNVPNPGESQHLWPVQSWSSNPRSNVPVSSSPPSRSRERSRSPTPASRARYPGIIRTFADLPGGNDSDKQQELYVGGAKSGIIVQDTKKDVDASFVDKATDSAVDSSRSSFLGTAPLLSGETFTAEPEEFTYTVTLWKNGFTINDGPLKTLDNPVDASFLENVQNLESLHELSQMNGMPRHFKLIRRQEENFTEPPKPNTQVQDVGRTLGGSTSSGFVSAQTPASSTAPQQLVLDPAAPITTIQLRLADGTRLITRFNTHHTVRDIRGFMDASKPNTSKDYQLRIMGFPPKPLPDFDQTIDDAGIANSVLIQKY